MQLLFSHDKLSQLPGAAQRVLFRMLEVVADTVYSNEGRKKGGGRRNEHVLRRLLEQLHTTMAIYHVWGSPFLGGGHLVRQHRDTRHKITGFVEKMQTEFKQDLAAPGLVERLPEECIREILLRLNDPSDILRAGESCVAMDRIACEKRVWRELVQTHFTKAQIEFILSERPELKDNKDWQALHTALRRRYGIRQNYTEMLMLCRRCCALFWKSIGHPCLVPEHIATIGTPSSSPSLNTNNSSVCYVDEKRKLSDPVAGTPRPIDRQRIRSGDDTQFETSPELFVPVTPQTFLTFFSV
jgi:F-box protein 25/32